MRMLKPRRLRSGDKVSVVAPASGFAREEFDKGIAELQKLGFEPVFEESVFARGHYVAGESRVRAAAFLSAWRDPAIRAIVAVRGGYGSVQLLPYLDAGVLRHDPKAFVGYSDLTSVLTHLTIGCGIVSFHGPMLDRRLGDGPHGYDRETFVRSLTSLEPLGELTFPGLETFKEGEAEGVLVGGTLTQLVASLGTPYAFAPPKGHVLFLEDVSERPYRLDRMLTQLRFAGVLALASAVVLGEFVGCDEPQGEPLARGTLAELFKDFAGPVIFGFPSGHTDGPSITLPFGVKARVVATGAPKLVIEETGVA
jgi:muramoyltetrapeptide carboxypeptidase